MNLITFLSTQWMMMKSTNTVINVLYELGWTGLFPITTGTVEFVVLVVYPGSVGFVGDTVTDPQMN